MLVFTSGNAPQAALAWRGARVTDKRKDQHKQEDGGLAPRGALDLSPFAFSGTVFSRQFWQGLPALAWTRDDAGRISPCHATCVHDGPTNDAAPRALPAEVVARLGGDARSFLVLRVPAAAGAAREVGVALDITHHQAQLDELLHLAVEDEMTGLYNRRGFQLFADHELRAARRHRTDSAVLFVDFDGLKDINDRLGHERGDALLIQTARLLHEVFRECDVIGRIGGDEFAVFAPDVRGDPEQLRVRLLTRLAEWCDEPGTPSELRISAGLAFSRAGQSKTLAQLLTEADLAMYADKAGKARP
jgi:diguanylate cyclase (GGDEF)-like protein